MHFNDCSFDLAVILVDAGMLQRVPDSFLKVVPIASSAIWGIEIELDFESTSKRLADPPRKE